jgi:hypothetical protein
MSTSAPDKLDFIIQAVSGIVSSNARMDVNFEELFVTQCADHANAGSWNQWLRRDNAGGKQLARVRTSLAAGAVLLRILASTNKAASGLSSSGSGGGAASSSSGSSSSGSGDGKGETTGSGGEVKFVGVTEDIFETIISIASAYVNANIHLPQVSSASSAGDGASSSKQKAKPVVKKLLHEVVRLVDLALCQLLCIVCVYLDPSDMSP